jgi:DNA-binding MarR family transcriptional regulator
MPRRRAAREHRLAELDAALRRVNAQAVLISQAVATKAGLSSTDLECLDLLHLERAATPSRLAAVTGLTTGAVSVMVDRLERRRFVRRRPNPSDARSVLVEVMPEAAKSLQPLYAPLAQSMAAVNERYSDDQLALVLDYLTRAYDAGAAHLGWLKVAAPSVTKGTEGGRDVSSRIRHARR